MTDATIRCANDASTPRTLDSSTMTLSRVRNWEAGAKERRGARSEGRGELGGEGSVLSRITRTGRFRESRNLRSRLTATSTTGFTRARANPLNPGGTRGAAMVGPRFVSSSSGETRMSPFHASRSNARASLLLAFLAER
ncbi:hypothetical protein KM043_001747 [Ampulex compressa]|nr:hypothetical protein KM043_001747 [Ampulex compressa]